MRIIESVSPDEAIKGNDGLFKEIKREVRKTLDKKMVGVSKMRKKKNNNYQPSAFFYNRIYSL